MTPTGSALVAQARSLRAQIDGDRRTNRAGWERADAAFASGLRAQGSALEQTESHGIRLAAAALALLGTALIALIVSVAWPLPSTDVSPLLSWVAEGPGVAVLLLVAVRLVFSVRSILVTLRWQTRATRRLQRMLSEGVTDDIDKPLPARR